MRCMASNAVLLNVIIFRLPIPKKIGPIVLAVNSDGLVIVLLNEIWSDRLKSTPKINFFRMNMMLLNLMYVSIVAKSAILSIHSSLNMIYQWKLGTVGDCSLADSANSNRCLWSVESRVLMSDTKLTNSDSSTNFYRHQWYLPN